MEKGEYLSLPKIAEAYGALVDLQSGLRSARNYCAKCVQLGGRWSQWDSWGQGVLFLYLRREYREEHEHAWALFEKHLKDTGKQVAIVLP